jgi:PAS domain S-box-containing protein
MRSAWKPLLVVIGLLLLITYLFVRSRSQDAWARVGMHEALQALQLHDAELTRDVLLARAGLLRNYDSLPRTGQKLHVAVAALRTGSATATDSLGEDVAKRVESLAGALEQKLQLVEHFTSDNAVLRNSSTYFTYSAQHLSRQLAAEKPVTDEITALSQAVGRFMHAPDPGSAQQAEQTLDRLSGRSRFRRDELPALLVHGRLIVQMLPQVDGLLRQIIASPTAARAESLQDAVLRYSHQIEARAQVFRALLYLVAVVLLGYLLYQFGRLRAGARALRRANDELRASEERFRAITESANDAIISADASGRVVSWNARAEALFGYTPDEAVGMPVARLIPTRYQASHAPYFTQWRIGGPVRAPGQTVELVCLRKDGREFPAEISLSTWSTAQGPHVTATVRDLTARKQLEETTRQQELQLIQASKMTALGTLVSGVAHEINNPNQLILTNTRVLADAWSDAVQILDAHAQERGDFSLGGLAYDEMRKTALTLTHDIHASAVRIDRIINELRDFARPRGTGALGLFDVNEAVQRALRLLAHPISRRTHHLHVDLAPALPAVRGDAQQIEQVVVNLVINALEALPDPTRSVTVQTLLDAAARGVTLEVRDEGVGIPPEQLARVCEPFFTTKQASGGTGLGLAITASLVRGHGGRLTFTSQPGRGTCARVTLPLASPPDPAVGDADGPRG